jgi:hypothetical protein
VWAQSPSPAAAPSAAAEANGLPPKWDKRIPLPKGAVLLSSTTPKAGIVYSADFSVVGKYEDLVNFYETGLAKAGFKLGPKAAIPARKVYNRTFTWTDILDSVVISPDPKDPSKFIIAIAYTPPREE